MSTLTLGSSTTDHITRLEMKPSVLSELKSGLMSPRGKMSFLCHHPLLVLKLRSTSTQAIAVALRYHIVGKFGKFTVFKHLVKMFGKSTDQPKGY